MKQRILQIAKWASALSFALLALPQISAAQEDSTGFVANADTYLRSTSPDNTANFGNLTFMFVRNSISSYMQLGLIRFDASSVNLPPTVQLDSAKVLMTVGTTLNTAVDVRLISVADNFDSWDEQAITWSSYKAGDLDTSEAIATTHVSEKHTRYSWDVTDHIREELVNGNKIVTLAVFQNFNTGANTTFVTKDSVTDDANKPILALFTHVVPVKVVMLTPSADAASGTINLTWKTPAETNTSYAVVERSTDGTNFSEISGHLAAQGTSSDSTDYSYTDNSAVTGYTNYYRIKYVMTDNSTYTSEVVSAPFFIEVAAVEDSYVRLSNNGTNYGSDIKLLVKNDGNSAYSRIAFLKFDLSSLTGTAQAARLHLTVNSANSSAGSVTWYLWNVDDDSWTESAITGQNYPALSDSSQILSTQPGRSSGSVDFDIPVDVIREAVNADGILSLAITGSNVSSTDDVSFVSRDSSAVSARPVILISEDPADNVTPVELSRLTATGGNGKVTLNWKAFTELNTDRFDIERSREGKTFQVIGSVAARGTAASAKAYSYIDAFPVTGSSYYRLKAVDQNGRFSYSNIVSVRSLDQAATALGNIYPNPVHRGQQLSIELTGVTESFSVRMIDVSGRVRSVQKFSAGGPVKLSTSGLGTGIYYLQLVGDSGKVIGPARKVLIK